MLQQQKMAEQNTHIYMTICTNWIFDNCDLKQICIQRLLKSIDLEATNVTFFTKYECLSYFLSKPTKNPQLNHWVNTT